MQKTATTIPAKNVDEYLYPLPEDTRAALEKVRRVIKAAAPKAEEVISYYIPCYKYMGALVLFAAFKDHCSFFVVNKNILKVFTKELQSFKTSGATIHFTPDHPLPTALIQKIVKQRIKENEGLKTAKKSITKIKGKIS